MSIAARIGTNISDVFTFGPNFLRRHFSRLAKQPMIKINLKSGPIYLRAGESDVAAIRQVFGDSQYACHNPAVEGRVLNRLRSIEAAGRRAVIVDAGANIGAASLWFARKYPTATIVAIEPEPGNFAILKQNAALVPNIIALQAAIGCEPGFVEVHNEGLGWAARTSRASQGVPVVTVAAAIQQVDGGFPFIVKVDIEGFESDLFSTNLDWIAETQVIHFEPHDWLLPGRYTSGSAQRAIGQHPFELYIAGDILTYVR